MKSVLITFPGTNRERDMAMALERASGRPPKLVWHTETELPNADLIVIPGGFAYGDYLRAGAMASHTPAMRSVVDRASQGVAILGVCNGFQILTEIGLLPGALMRNAGLKFICRNLDIRVETTDCLFTADYTTDQCISIPVAHNDGNYFADNETLDRLEGEDRIAFRYVNTNGQTSGEANPNGSARSIAGILNQNRRVLGFMPHPENATDPALGGLDGCPLFDALTRALS
ncbi:MAG: phosphoribosylformylglycinamidine synthase I [Rhodospirillaceae bacterium]|nr:phosphoribosylformylglycinamidine synthase I [Rhodospirillaceae bacterium]